MTNRLFYEVTSDDVAHTPFSVPLVTDRKTRDMIETQLEDFFPNHANLVEAYEKWGATEEPNQLAHNIRNKTEYTGFLA